MTLKIAMLDRGTWTVSGVSDEGAWDAGQDDPERARRLSDAASRGFSVNENVDKPADSSSDMSEPGMIPHAYKIAALRASAAELRKAAAAGAVPGLKVTVPSLKAPQAPRLPKMQAPKALDPRTDKPPGMNLMHGVTTVSNGSDVGASYTSFSRRLQGSPV